MSPAHTVQTTVTLAATRTATSCRLPAPMRRRRISTRRKAGATSSAPKAML